MTHINDLEKQILKKMKQGKAKLNGKPIIGITKVNNKKRIMFTINTYPFFKSVPLNLSFFKLIN